MAICSIVIIVGTLFLLFSQYRRRFLPIPQTQEEELIPVTYVFDGDTITVAVSGKEERVRLIGIDTPERETKIGEEQCFAEESFAKMESMVLGKIVRLTPDPTQDDRDIYGRLLRYVFLEDGTHVNRHMIAEGYAVEYTYAGRQYQYMKDFQQAESEARQKEIGRWAINACMK